MWLLCVRLCHVTRDKWVTIDDDSLAEAADADSPNVDKFYQRVVSSDEEDCCDSDDRDMSEEEDFIDLDDGSIADMSDEEDCCDSDVGSMADLEWDTWADACTLAFQGAVGAFPPEAADIRPADVFRNSLFPRDECANTVVSVRRDVPMSPVIQFTNKGVDRIPPVTDRHVQRMVSRSVGWCTYSVQLCLLYPDSTEDLQDLRGGSVDSQRLDHWRTVSWDPGIVDSLALSVCYRVRDSPWVCGRSWVRAPAGAI